MSEMSEQNSTQIQSVDQAWKTKILVVGGVVGASLGLMTAYLFINKAEEGGRPEVGAGEAIKLGVWTFGLLRNILNLVD